MTLKQKYIRLALKTFFPNMGNPKTTTNLYQMKYMN